jgi:aryl-alcohol dehydrogenase-like predicted oxidoreductase
MLYVNLGRTGLKVSRLCLGMMTYGSKKWRPWILEEEQARPFVQRALEAGINFFDTADVYSLGESERVTGNLLKTFGVRRETVVVATKVYQQMSDDPNDRGLSRKHVLDSIDQSLRRLQMDYVDLYQIHRWDYTTPIEETLEALTDVVRAARPATSVRPRCSPGSLPRPCTSPRNMVGRALSPCKTTTISFIGRKSAR